MTFENFSRLTLATVLNTPLISSFNKVEIDPKKVKRGDLFISNSKEDIQLALLNEAYAIVSEEVCEIIDDEVAWFKAPSLDDVLIRLLRFTLLEKKFRFVYLCDIKLELIKKIADKNELYFLSADEKQNYKKIINANEKSIFFSSNENFLKKIYPDYETLSSLGSSIFFEPKSTLFESQFTYKNLRYKNIKIPSIFLNHLELLVSFLEQNSISFEIEKCAYTSHFHPIFVNQKLQIKAFGKSDSVLICEADKELLNQELLYLKEHAPWAKTIYLEIDDIKKLKKIEFNFAIIITAYDKLIEKLHKIEKKGQTLLF